MALIFVDGFDRVMPKGWTLADEIQREIDKEIIREVVKIAKLENTAVDDDGNVIEGTAFDGGDDLDWLRE